MKQPYRAIRNYKEIGAVLAMPEGSVATNIRRGLEKLRVAMSQSGLSCAAPALYRPQRRRWPGPLPNRPARPRQGRSRRPKP